jgi:hypothetical protein
LEKLHAEVEKVSDHGTIGPRKLFEFPENICKKRKKDNCRNLDKGRNSEDKFCPEPNGKNVTCTVCMTSCRNAIRSTSILLVQ